RSIVANGDGTSTVTLHYTFSSASTPKLWQLGGTVFTVAVPTASPTPIVVTSSTPVASLNGITPSFSTSVTSTTQLTLTVRVAGGSDVASARSFGVGGDGANPEADLDRAVGIPDWIPTREWLRRIFNDNRLAVPLAAPAAPMEQPGGEEIEDE